MTSYLESIRSRVGRQCIILPGVRAVVLNDRGEVLLQRRTDMDCWGLPAGSVELHETALEALRREVMEETRLEVRHAEPMALYSGPSQRFRYPNGDEVQGFAIAFIVRQWTGEPQADGVEGSEVRFWPIDTLPRDMVAIHARTLADFKQYKGHFTMPNELEPGGNT
ncbi:NUDIX domain-containing protein [Candidatus Sumerlaeota bacterium]|nr:NUDIX domain-containing protein [Candidatus Sumerlaeota bacterium]